MNTKSLIKGFILLLSFAVILFLIFLPIYGQGRNGLHFSDDFFNSLAKGSSNYMPQMREAAQPYVGQPFAVEIKMVNALQAQRVAELYTQAGAQVGAAGPVLKINGNLGQVLLRAVDDAEVMYNNQGDKLEAKYQYTAKEALRNWWLSFNKIDTALKKQKKFAEANAVSEVIKRALEPAYNFYGIPTASVGANTGMLIFMLIFYVVYTLWYGFGIFEIFEGIGLSMEKAETKEEV